MNTHLFYTKKLSYSPTHKSYFIVIILFLFSFYGSFAQIDTTAQKFHTKLQAEKSAATKVELYKDLCWHYRYICLDSCVKYGKIGIELAKKNKLKKLESDITRFIGISYWHYAFEEESLEWVYASLKVSESINDKSGIGFCYDNIGNTFFSQHFYEKALYNFQKAEKLFEEINDKKGLSYSKLHCGWVFNEIKQFDSAFIYINEAIELRKEYGDSLSLILATKDLGNVYLNKGDYRIALDYFQTALNKIPISQYHTISSIQQQVAEAYRLFGKNDSAIYFGKKSLILAEQYDNYRQIIKTCRTLMLCKQAIHEHDDAYKYQEKYYETKEKLLNDKIAIKLNRKEIEKEYEIKGNAIKLRNRIILAVLLLLITGLLITIRVASRNQKKTVLFNKNLQQKNEEISNQKVTLEVQKEELHKLNEVKNKIFSVVSHDIRSPLASLKGMLDLYNKNAITNEEIRALMPEITTHVNNTSIFVDNLLYWSKSQFTGIIIQKTFFDINTTIHRELKLIEYTSTQKEISLELNLQENNLVYADENMISVVLRNLITNAIKFSKQKDNIIINTKKNNNKITVSVTDYGKGMTIEQVNLLFITNHTTVGTMNEKGTGLGLMLCKDFTTRNNGRIWAESIENNGSTFYIELPCDKD